MRDSLHYFMKPGIVYFVTFPCVNGDGPIIESISKICQDPFFEAIDITWVKDPSLRAQVKEILEISGMKITYIIHPWLLHHQLDLNSADQEHRKKAVEMAKLAIDDARFYQAEQVSLISGAYTGEAEKKDALQRLQDSLLQLCEYAQQYQMDVILEIFDQTIDKKRLIGKTADARDLAAQIRTFRDNFGLMVDLSHIPMLNENPAQALQPVQEFLKQVHIGNCLLSNRHDAAWGDKHPRFGYPGSENDVRELVSFLQELFNIGYLKKEAKERPIVSFEVGPITNEKPELLIAQSKRKLHEAWIQVNL